MVAESSGGGSRLHPPITFGFTGPEPVKGSSTMRRACRIAVVAVVLAGTVVVSAVSRVSAADLVLLQNGDHLVGELQLAEVAVRTSEGIVTLARRDVWQVALGGARGDLVTLGNGRMLAGLVDRPGYEIRLPSGQAISFGRSEIGRLQLGSR